MTKRLIRIKIIPSLPLSPEEMAVYEGAYLAEPHLIIPKLLEEALQTASTLRVVNRKGII